MLGGVNRSTPIDLKTIDAEVAALTGRSPRTPIGMKELWDEVQNLKATAKSWEIVTLNINGSNTYPFPSKYSNWNWIVLAGRMTSQEAMLYTRNHNSLSVRTEDNKTVSGAWTKTENSIKAPAIINNSNTITVLFYK